MSLETLMTQHESAKNMILNKRGSIGSALQQSELDDLVSLLAAFAVDAPKRTPTTKIVRELNRRDPNFIARLVMNLQEDTYADTAVEMVGVMHEITKAKNFRQQQLSRIPMLSMIAGIFADVIYNAEGE